jgi:hypothetical protein
MEGCEAYFVVFIIYMAKIYTVWQRELITTVFIVCSDCIKHSFLLVSFHVL